MADKSYQPGVYRKQGGNEFVVAAAGEINVESGGEITAAGTQASHITDLGDSANGAAIATAVNAILVALEGVGITATS